MLFALPSKRTLETYMQNTNIMPGFNDAVFDALREKVQTMDPTDRCISLIFDEMALKSALVYNHRLDRIEGFEDIGELGMSQFIADHALAFMVRGLHTKWKQPLGYFLTAGTVKPETLQTLTQSCLEKLEKIGLQTKVLCDQGPNNRCLLQKLENVSTERPYIVSNNKKVFVVYDPPHLLRNVRNNCKKSNYKYGDVEVKWEYIVDFYNMEKVMSIRMAPNLTDKHITVPPFFTMWVNLAALYALECLPDDASGTAEFIETFDHCSMHLTVPVLRVATSIKMQLLRIVGIFHSSTFA